MAQWSVAAAKKKINRAFTEKEEADTLYREALELVFPDREVINKRSPGQDKNQENWDGQATVSLIRAANRYSSDFTPQFSKWFEIGLGPAATAMPDSAFEATVGKAKKTVKLELEATTAISQAVFQGPGFATASHELYLDYLIGMGGMSIMPNEDILGAPVLFTSMPLGHFWPQKGPNNILDKWFFWQDIKANDIIHQWTDAVLPEELIEKAAKDNAPDVKLVAVCYRDYDIKKKTDKPFRYEVFWSSGKNYQRIVERQMVSSPFVTPRYMVLAGENMGRGPVLFSIPDIRTANKIVEMTLRSAALAVGGVWTAADGGLVGEGTVKIAPLSVIRVRHNGGPTGPSLQRLETPQRLDFSEILLDKLHENIKKVLGDNSLPAEAGPVRSATEFIKRIQDLISDAAGGLGRLHGEMVVPMVQRVIDILDAKQILPAGLAPAIDQFIIQVRLTSPLAKQEALNEVQNLVRFMEILGKVGGPELQHLVMRVDDAMVEIGNLMDVSERFINTPEERTKAKAAIAEMVAQQAGGQPGVASAEVKKAEAARTQGP